LKEEYAMANNTIFNILRCQEILQNRFPKATVNYELGALHRGVLGRVYEVRGFL
jgi:hypothetical protein